MKTKMVAGLCGKILEDHRPWWETEYIVYGFNNPRVRSKLERLVNTYIVRATDKVFMLQLQQRIREEHRERMWLKILSREDEEVEREKRLILEGKMKVEEAPEELAYHPVFRINKLANRIIKEMRVKAKADKKSKKLKSFDYELIDGMEEVSEEDYEMSSCPDIETSVKRDRRLQDHVEFIEDGLGVSEEDYARIKYEDSEVEELRGIEMVDDLYEVADEIVGPLTGKTCGGLSRHLGQSKAKEEKIPA